MITYFKRKSFVSVALSVLLSVLFVYVGVSASTTISTDIVTDGDTTIGSGARVGTGSTGTHFTALADDSFFVEGAMEADGIIWGDGGIVGTASSTMTSSLMVSGAMYASSTLGVTGIATFVTNVGLGATTSPGTLLGVQGRIVSLDLFTGNIIATGTAQVRGNSLFGTNNNSGTVGVATSTLGTGVVLGVNGRIVSLDLFTGSVMATGSLRVATTSSVGTGLAIATSTSNGEVFEMAGNGAFMSTGTSTLKLSSSDETSAAASGGCIQLDATNGAAHRIYIQASTSAITDSRFLVVEPGECQR